ncbi:MAG TPA: DUF4062 domain-containing protein [Nitrososphaera sp.]|nr:DUF4062 domain-containing protein [Nitrososphaera sp.]
MSKETAVFLSSTWEDLEEHRRLVLHTLAKFKRQVTGMEYFGARSGEPLEVCLSEVRKSGVYIGIVGTRYGSIAKDGKSFTELEYEEALNHNKNILIYVIDEQTHPVLPKHVDKGENATRLSNFKEKLLSKHVCRSFSSPDNLASQIGIDLINIFEDIGENIRAALKDDFSHLLFDAGFLFAGEMALMVSLEPDGEAQGGFRFGDKALEAIMASAFLAQSLHNSKFDVLKHFVTFRYEIWEMLIYFLSRSGLNEEALSNEIFNCADSLRLRLLIKLAGKLKIAPCTEAICARLFDRIPHHKIIQGFQLEVTPFNRVVQEALREVPESSRSIIQKYIDLAKAQNKWQVKQILERALKAKPNMVE